MSYTGLTEQERDVYAVARFVKLPCERIDPFLKVLAMCGYELRRAEESPAAGEIPK